jgi:hypothetical protein
MSSTYIPYYTFWRKDINLCVMYHDLYVIYLLGDTVLHWYESSSVELLKDKEISSQKDKRNFL